MVSQWTLYIQVICGIELSTLVWQNKSAFNILEPNFYLGINIFVRP